MKREIWWEVFSTDEEGTGTWRIAKTLNEAMRLQNQLMKNHPSRKFLIDKWEMQNGHAVQIG